MAPMELGPQEQEEPLRPYCVLAVRQLAEVPAVVVAGVAESAESELAA